MKTPRILTSRIAAAAALIFTPALHAADRFWIDSLGGAFDISGNWSATDGGVGGATVPAAADVANFTLNNTYTVTFNAAATNLALDVENGNVTFDLNGLSYTATSNFGAAFIGNVSGQTGRLTIRDGAVGVDTNGDDLFISTATGSTGFLTVTTGGILGTAALRPDFFIGSNGAGTLTVNDNGRINGRTFAIGLVSGATGTMTITGPNAVADFTSVADVGQAGTGTLSVTNGGTLTNAGIVTLGSELGADGTATVSGIGSSWTMSSTASIGNFGDGTLTISAGGLVSSAGIVTLSTNGTGVGTATVTGAGSRWNVASTQTIGQTGLGVMTVSSGGQVVSSANANLGLNAGSEGRVTVTGTGSQWTLGSQIIVGNGGTGDLTVSAGGEVSAASVAFGNNSTGRGVATVTGTGSKLTTTGNVTVANVGDGTLCR